MAPAVSKRRRQQPDEHIPETIFDSLNPAKQSQRKEEGPSTAELMQRLAEVNAKLEASERDRQLDMARRTAPPAAPTQIEAPKLDLAGLPDPVVDKDAYAAEIARRTIAFQNDMATFNQKRADAAKPQQLGDPDALWEDFTEQFPDYTDNEDRIRFATSQVVGRLAKRGIDVQKLMYGQPDRFFKEITDFYDKTFGSPTTESDDDDKPEPRERTARRQRSDDEPDGDDGRDDVFGGSDAPAGGERRAEQPKPGDFIKDLHDLQRKSGYF